MHYFKNITYALIASLLLFSGCGKDEDPEPVGNPPTANAGSDLNAKVNSSVTLNGTGSSDPDGALTYVWALTTLPSGSSASVNSATQATATFTPDVEGTYVATLTVTDTDGNNATDATTITVTEAVGNPPVAVIANKEGRRISEADKNNTVTVTASYELDGSGSYDDDQDALTYAWIIASKPSASAAATITGNNQSKAGFTPDVAGEYVIRLTVSDPGGNTNAAEVTLVANESAVLINSNITADRTLEDIFTDPSQPDYRVTQSITASAVLTVKPGVVIEFDENTYLTVASGGGALIADGEATNKITFTTSNIAGNIRWGGLYFTSQDSRNVLNNVIVTYAGGSNSRYANFVNAAANVGLTEGAKVEITNSEISQGGGYGVFVRFGELLEFSSNNINNNALSGIGLPITVAGVLDAATTFADNTVGAVEVFGSTIVEDITLVDLSGDAYYYVSGDLTANADLTIEAGTELRMEEDAFITITDEGAFIVNGTEANRVIFTALDEDNPWGGIKLTSTSSRNKIEYATITQAGSQTTRYANFVNSKANVGLSDGAKLALTNTIISDGEGLGLYVRFGEITTFGNNSFIDNAEWGIGLSANQAGMLDRNTSFSGNTKGAVVIITNSTLTSPATWVALKDGAKYNVFADLTIHSSLTIEPGAQFVFESDAFLLVEESGSLIADGTADSTIVFTSNQPGVFRWKGIYINSSTSNNVLDHVEVSYGGSSNYRFANFVNAVVNVGVGSGATVAITNSTITNSSGYGIYADGTVAPDAESGAAGNTFTGNPSGNLFK